MTEYYRASGLDTYLDELGFNTVGYGCTTCIGNSGPLPDAISAAVTEGDLVVGAVLSGNRNFEARIHGEVKANYLASPPLVVAYALAGRMDVDLVTEPLGQGSDGEDVFLRDLWPSRDEIDAVIGESVRGKMSRRRLRRRLHRRRPLARARHAGGRALRVGSTTRRTFGSRRTSTGMPREPEPVADIEGARCLVMIGDSVTTDHISPAGAIRPDSPAGKYLIEHGVERNAFNSYGARRGNHEVMMRGTFANVRLRNQLVPGSEGTWTRPPPRRRGGDDLRRRRAVPRRGRADDRHRRQGVRLRLVTRLGGEGAEPPRRARRDRGVVRAHPPLEPADDGHRSRCSSCPARTRESLGLTGREEFSITGVENGDADEVTVRADDKEFRARVRLDTPREREYFRHGGILQYVLRRLLGES